MRYIKEVGSGDKQMQVITFGTPVNNGIENGRIQVISLAPVKVETQEVAKPSAVKKLQKEAKVHGKTEVAYDVYCDRVNFIGFYSWMVSFFQRRDVVADYDRCGVSISRQDAEALGFPVAANGYRLPSDVRRKPVVMN